MDLYGSVIRQNEIFAADCGENASQRAPAVSPFWVHASPNPFTETVTLHANEPAFELRIRDITGKTVCTTQIVTAPAALTLNLPAGIYFATYQSPTHENYTEKWVVLP